MVRLQFFINLFSSIIINFQPDGEKLGWSHAGQNAIRLSQADRSHSGEYTCLVQEGMNSGSPNVGITTGTLTVLVKPSPPRIIKPSGQYIIVSGPEIRAKLNVFSDAFVLRL